MVLQLAAGSGKPWTLTGWQPYTWELSMTMETGSTSNPEIGPLPMRVPGSVQQALLDAGLIRDWRVGLNARECEWVENRHWVLETTLKAGMFSGAGPHRLILEGVDGRAVIMLDNKKIGTIDNTFHTHALDLGDPGKAAKKLRIIFVEQPRALGQVHRTSQIRDWKARYPYVWDWTPRVAQVGVWDGVHVQSGPMLHGLQVGSDLNGQGQGEVSLNWDKQGLPEGSQLEVVLNDRQGKTLARKRLPGKDGLCSLAQLNVETWWPNGHGEQPLYDLTVDLWVEGGVHDTAKFQLGFRRISWAPCRGAPVGARDWICEVNGKAVFMQGANWVPLRTCFADTTPEEVDQRLTTYRDLGFNLLRIWGGSVLERRTFYEKCDALGLMVWQEFPLSSSGIDNHPPDDPRLISDMRRICADYIGKRSHHASLILWCGGNELQRAKDGGPGTGRPCDESEPMLAAQAEICAALDPCRRYIPTSSSGPRFMADAAEVGQGLHHDVHGPWNWSGDLDGWNTYWDNDDALLRSESGFPGAQAVDLTRRYGGPMAWPAERANPYWGINSGWWIQWEDYQRETGKGELSLEHFVEWSQTRQAAALGHAAGVCKQRFPACAGFIVWMGHDCFPCPANTSVIDVEGRPKPAALALARVFRDGNF